MNESVIIALIGVFGALVGALGAASMRLISLAWEGYIRKSEDKPKKELLVEMLESPDHQWRKLETLTHVIGSDEPTTKRLLLEVGARASEDGNELWGLKRRNPFE